MEETPQWESPLTGQRYVLCKRIEMSSRIYVSDPETIHLILNHFGHNDKDTVKWMLETGLIAGRIHECQMNNRQEETQ